MSDLPSREMGGRKESDFAIIINGELVVVPQREVSYAEVTSIAYPVPPTPDMEFTVTYEKAEGSKHEGILIAGQIVEVKKEGTTFRVTPTDKS
jgi:hypothetical protein